LSARGFTLIEFLVVVIAICILTGVALDRLLPLIGRAERVAFLQVHAQLQSALLLETADRITAGESQTLVELDGTNPMALLLQAPSSYRGAIRRPEPDELPGRTWYYDEYQGYLVYRVGKHTRFEALGGPPNRVEFVIRFVYRDRDGNGFYDAGRDIFDGMRLEPVHPYAWPD
jgi:prepilin-type N-terminal cleavage/methylation domain-containing protein